MSDDITGNSSNGVRPDASADYGTQTRPARDWIELHPLTVQLAPALLHQSPEEFAADPERASRLAAMRTRFLHRADFDRIPPLEWLIEGYLLQRKHNRLLGKWGSAKSFLAVDWACCVATGRSWNGTIVRTGPRPVVYLALEDPEGIVLRVKAWELANQPVGDNFLLYDGELSVARHEGYQKLVLSQEWRDFTYLCQHEFRPALVAIDTQHELSLGLRENDSSDMGYLNRAMKHLERDAATAGMLIHHLSAAETAGGRGSTALVGASDCDTVIKLEERRGQPSHVLLKSGKKKNSAAQADVDLHLLPLMDSAVLVTGLPDWKQRSRLANLENANGPDAEIVIFHPAMETLRLLREAFDHTEILTPVQLLAVLPDVDAPHLSRRLAPLIENGELLRSGLPNRPLYQLTPWDPIEPDPEADEPRPEL